MWLHPGRAMLAADTIEISDSSLLPESPLVSIYMLTYMHERFIAEAIEGVIAQRCDFQIELIIGEDCSPDGTRAIALEYQARHPGLIRVLTAGANVGRRANAARCRAACRGRYIAICEGDDRWTDPGKLAAQVRVLEHRPDAVICFHDVSEIDEAGRAVGSSKLERLTGKGLDGEISSAGLFDGTFIPTLSVLYRNIDAGRRIPSLDIVNGDTYLFSMLAPHGIAKGIDATMGAYRRHAGGVWSSMPESRRHLEALRTYVAIATDVEDEFAISIAKPLSIRIANAWAHRTDEISGDLYPLLRRAYILSILCPFRARIRSESVSVSIYCAVFPVLRALKTAFAKRRAENPRGEAR
jgi:glycosyltransferase involved in cell wall biosynthesis